ncbi:phage baseplate assembly protein V [Bradyrhizobium glycinis]|uniref:phage baseplate assembly protein V n=1 Tax=Bradyrhizobium glycinis TaxID=2751812 RepID=UPI0018DA250B|nr:phage baseplate assembly protein V [Bradyrhizobium glycinis]
MMRARTRKRFFGKYRGVVEMNADPELKGRIQVMVPDVLGTVPTTWALPCLPNAGVKSGVHVIPAVGTNVWVEFEHGDPNKPIWTGCFWGSTTEAPVTPTPQANPILPPDVVVQTVAQNTILVSGNPATGITLSCGPPLLPTSPRITISPAGIMMTDGKGGSISIIAGVVAINELALVVK